MNYWCDNTADNKVMDIPIFVFNVGFCRRLKHKLKTCFKCLKLQPSAVYFIFFELPTVVYC